MIESIQGELLEMDEEEALVFLKDFALEKRYTEVDAT